MSTGLGGRFAVASLEDLTRSGDAGWLGGPLLGYFASLSAICYDDAGSFTCRWGTQLLHGMQASAWQTKGPAELRAFAWRSDTYYLDLHVPECQQMQVPEAEHSWSQISGQLIQTQTSSSHEVQKHWKCSEMD